MVEQMEDYYDYLGNRDLVIVAQFVYKVEKPSLQINTSMEKRFLQYMGQVMKVWLSCYLVVLSNDSKTR